jgi:lysosomal Pro-X carboxypeptidase
MVMPMCSDGVNDMFEPMEWDEAKYIRECKAKFWGVQPQPKLVANRYGGLDLVAASSNNIFR